MGTPAAPDPDPGGAPEVAAPVADAEPTVLSKLQKWGDSEAFGLPVEPTKFIPMKTPLSCGLIQNWQLEQPPAHSHTVPELLEQQRRLGRRVGLILELTNHESLYSCDLPDSVTHTQVPLVAKELPSVETVQVVIRTARAFWSQHPNDYIAIHCSYGYNRTGFVVSSYLCECCGLGVEEALAAFAAARPPGVKHERFVEELQLRYARNAATSTTGGNAASTSGGGGDAHGGEASASEAATSTAAAIAGCAGCATRPAAAVTCADAADTAVAMSISGRRTSRESSHAKVMNWPLLGGGGGGDASARISAAAPLQNSSLDELGQDDAGRACYGEICGSDGGSDGSLHRSDTGSHDSLGASDRRVMDTLRRLSVTAVAGSSNTRSVLDIRWPSSGSLNDMAAGESSPPPPPPPPPLSGAAGSSSAGEPSTDSAAGSDPARAARAGASLAGH